MLNKANKKRNLIYIALLSFILYQGLPVSGQDLMLWRNLNPQFFQRNGRQQLDKGIVPSSAYFLDESTGWMVGTNGGWLGESKGMMARTQDAGKTWQVEFSEAPSEFSDVFFVSRKKGWIVGTEQSTNNRGIGVLLETIDSGKSWQKRTIENFVRSDYSSIYFTNEDTGFITGAVEVEGQSHAAIFRSSDRGKHWGPVFVGKGKGFLRDIKFDNQGVVGWAIGDEGEILISKDRGKTWRKQETTFDGTLLGVAVLDKREVWITASDSSLLHTNNGGTNWKVVSPKINIKAVEDSALWFSGIFFDTRTQGWVCGSNGIILRTEDAGRSWQLEAIGQGDFLYKMIPVNKRIIAIGKDATLLQRKL